MTRPLPAQEQDMPDYEPCSECGDDDGGIGFHLCRYCEDDLCRECEMPRGSCRQCQREHANDQRGYDD